MNNRMHHQRNECLTAGLAPRVVANGMRNADCGLRNDEDFGFVFSCGACPARLPPLARGGRGGRVNGLLAPPAATNVEHRTSNVEHRMPTCEATNGTTPKGFRSASPGLPGYPGCDAETDINPERVALAGEPMHPTGRNPFRVRASFSIPTQGSPVGQPWAVLRNAFSVTRGASPAAKQKIRTLQSALRISPRSGATLTEVLIALLIMSIGLVALAVLFPLSVLRTIRGSQLTNATDARYNAEAAIDQFPNIVKNPAQITVLTGATNQDGQPTQALNAVPFYNTNYIFDPLGFAFASSLPATQPYAGYFGNNPNIAMPPVAPQSLLPRFAMTWTTIPLADSLVTLPDSWVLQFDGFMVPGSAVTAPAAATAGPTQIDVNKLSASGTTLPSPVAGQTTPLMRAVIFSADGTTSQTRVLTQINVNSVNWSENANGIDANGNGILDDYPLPASFVPGGRVRLEIQERRYSWLLTIRNSGAPAAPSESVDVVVFFQRKFDLNTDEYLYPATFNAGNMQVSVTYPVGTNPATNQPYKPFMKKGNYIFDANDAFWYRISNVVDNNQGAAQITLDAPASAGNSGANFPCAMFPRNVVDVYPLGSKAK